MTATAPASEIYVGVMSGTSVDGVDVAIVDFSTHPPRYLYTAGSPYPPALGEALRALCREQSSSLDALYRLDAELGELYAERVDAALAEAGLDARRIAAIGNHGQTLRHSPATTPAYTVQIGDANRIAARTGIVTVADFRRKDMAEGGEGAPLAPAFHRFLFHSEDEDRVLVNLGGIANVSSLPADPARAVTGFDTGPANTFLDYWSRKHLGRPFDDNGDWARDGRIDAELLDRLLDSEPFFSAPAPKSTGTEHFSANWLESRLRGGLAPVDVQATLVELSAVTVADAIRELPGSAGRVFACGGGAHNAYLLERLAAHLPGHSVDTTAGLGVDPDHIESGAFAWLARERLAGRPANLPTVTRAKKPTVLGAVYLP